MLVAITGTPGVGKSTVSAVLRERYEVIDIHSFAEENGLFEGFDEEAGSYDVDVDRLSDSLQDWKCDDIVFMDGHLSHFVDCDAIVVMRCSPGVIAERLRARAYDEAKVREHVQAEILDVILCESADSGTDRVYEIDCTALSPSEAAGMIEDIITGNIDGVPPGSVDWSKEMEEWF